MDKAAYDGFSATLLGNAERDPDVLGIVFAGSTADASRRDTWSDHDFLMIVNPGQQERYRQDLSWLPDSDQIVLRYRETEHGLTVIFAYGHLVEFAVFDPEEMFVMKANAYSVPLDKADIASRMALIAHRTTPETIDVAAACGHLMQILFAGVGRYARGEKLSAHAFIRQYALRRLLQILPAVLKPESADKLDTLDPFRRFERVLPELAAQIDGLQRLDALDTASGTLDLLDAVVKPHVSDYPAALHEVVKAHIAKAHG